MDCFYAAVEIRDKPELKDLPVAVGGRAKRGVITTANYIARKYGVRSAMPSAQAAKLCPKLVFVKPHFEKYKAESLKIREIFKRYTEIIEPLSLDEAYLDVSNSPHFQGSASLIAKDLRETIFKETGLTASAGIAPNKFLAKVASDWRKPNGQFTIRPTDIDDFVKKLSLAKIPGVGKVTYRKMELRGFKTCGDLQVLSKVELTKLYGKWGERLFGLVRGIDEREVKTSRIRKSLSVERTFFDDIHELEAFSEKFKEIFKEFEKRFAQFKLKQPEAQISGFVLKLKFSDFKQITREKAGKESPSLDEAIEFSEKIFTHFDKPIRLLGFGVRLKTQNEEDDSPQLEFEI